MNVHDLTWSEITSPEFLQLLWLACESDDATLLRLRDEHLPRLAVIGVRRGGTLLGFAAYKETAQGVAIEYIAAAPESQGLGVGTALIRKLRARHPGIGILAQTDDDAIGFYRSLGFKDTPAPPDERWPERSRYDCVLAPSANTSSDNTT